MFPFIHLSESLSIPTYYLVLSLTTCLCLLWARGRATAKNLEVEMVLDLGLIMMIAGFIGGRLFHVIYEEPAYYGEAPLRILEFWNGGFVFYGGALAAAGLALWYAATKDRKNIPNYLDLFAPVVALAYSLGRWACLFAGCCYGRSCDLPWAVHGLHPTQAYAALWEAGVVAILLKYERKNPPPGRLFYIWVALHACGRLVMESFRDDDRGPQWGLSISSWISIVLLIIGIYGIFKTASQHETHSSRAKKSQPL